MYSKEEKSENSEIMDILVFRKEYPKYNIYKNQPYVIQSKLMDSERFLISHWDNDDHVWELGLVIPPKTNRSHK